MNFGGATRTNLTENGETILLSSPLSSFISFQFLVFSWILVLFTLPRTSVSLFSFLLGGRISSGTISISAKLHDEAADIRAMDLQTVPAAGRTFAFRGRNSDSRNRSLLLG